jgi:hypothetical protein
MRDVLEFLRKASLAAVAAVGLALAGAPEALAQTSALTNQSANHYDAATAFCTVTNANTVNQQATATCTSAAGKFVYLTSIAFDVCSDATGVALTNVNFTVTNLTGSPVFATSYSGTDNCQHWAVPLPTPVQATAAGTNVTIVSPTASTHNAFNIVATYFLASGNYSAGQ